MAGKKDWSYIQPNYHFPNTTIIAIGTEYSERDAGGQLRHYVKCRCECGNEFIGRLDRLETTDLTKSPHTCRCKQCGQGRKKLLPSNYEYKASNNINFERINNIIGHVYDDYIVLDVDHTDKYGTVYYKCQCACGEIEVVRSTMILGTNAKNEAPRCACAKCLKSISSGERWIKNALNKLNIKNYKVQYSFNDLYGEFKPLRFDFALLNESGYPYCLIEFQGEQHYKPIAHFGGEEQFKKQQFYDNKKRDYCNKHNIKLLEIPYWKKGSFI